LSADGRTAAVSLTGQVHLVVWQEGTCFLHREAAISVRMFRFDGKIMLAATVDRSLGLRFAHREVDHSFAAGASSTICASRR